MSDRPTHSQALLQALVDGASDVVYVQDRDNRYLVIKSGRRPHAGQDRR